MAGWIVAPARAADALASRVVLLANQDDPDSLRIARHYAAVRGVPSANIIAFHMPTAETITWPVFVASVWQPLQDELVKQGWIDAIPLDLFDSIGRRKYAIAGHRIAALVVCRGVPLRIENDQALFDEVHPLTDGGGFRTNAGAVDSELSLLAAGNYPINALVGNPLFSQENPNEFQLRAVVKVSRLDGPTADEAASLVDRAVSAERTGLLGRACIDMGGEYPEGNRWLTTVEAQVASLGFDATVERSRWPLPETARCDATALYFGWHFPDINGPFSMPGFRFAPGAIAFHIHSTSAHTLRSATEGWCGGLVAAGATATLGNVYEPYLEYTHRPDLLLHALVRGWNLVDAAYYALPALSWQCVLIGDPLYRPFAVSFDEQWKNIDRLPPNLMAYATIRRMFVLDVSGDPAAALAEGRAALAKTPSLALGVAVGERLRAAGDSAGVEKALGSVDAWGELQPDQWALAHEAAQLLEACGRPGSALPIYRRLFSYPQLPWSMRGPWLVDARRAALAAGDGAQAAAWKKDLDALIAHVLREKK
jgi:uncharacterized protein (TIGR03790 family)